MLVTFLGSVSQAHLSSYDDLSSNLTEFLSTVSPFLESHTPASSSPFQVLEPPMLSIGKGDTVIQILPTALRFWEKLGLGPRAGKKDVTAFVFYEDAGAGPASEHKQGLVGNWLASVAALYKVRVRFNLTCNSMADSLSRASNSAR